MVARRGLAALGGFGGRVRSAIEGCVSGLLKDEDDGMNGSERIPKLSIGMPVYNGDDYLDSAIESILSQSYSDFELVISDNCSDDGTAEICERFAARDDRVRVLRNETNIGAAGNFNRVVEISRGEFFAWANHDDMWSPEYFERCVDLLDDRADAVLAYSRGTKIDEHGAEVAPLLDDLGLDGTTPSGRLHAYYALFRRINANPELQAHASEGLWTPVYGVIRRDRLLRTGMIGSYVSSDTVLLEELLMHGAFAEVPERLFHKRDHPGRSMRACLSFDKRIEWFTGRRRPMMLFPHWRLFFERLRAVGRSGMPFGSTLSCGLRVVSYTVRRRGLVLCREILTKFRRAFELVVGKLLPTRGGSAASTR